MINGIISVLVVFTMLSVGFLFTRKKLWPENTNQVFSITVIKIAAPALAITSIGGRFTPELLRSSARNLILAALSILLLHLIGKVLSLLLSMSEKKKAVFQVTFTFNNIMFIGLPIIQIVFGSEALPYLFTFYLVTILLFWSLGAYQLSSVSGLEQGGFSLRKMFSPGLCGVIIGCVLAGFQITLPQILLETLTYLGNICVPLSLLVIGSNLSRSLAQGIPPITPDQLLILAGKFVISPLIVFALFSLAGVGGFPLRVFILSAALPCHTQTAILAQFYDLEGQYASNLVSLSTLVSLLTIPVYAAFLA